MFSRLITHFTEDYEKRIDKIKEVINHSDAIIVGAGAGLSTSAEFSYSGERFKKYFLDFADKYGITDMYSGGFYPFPSLEEFWAWWSRHILINRYKKAPKPVYDHLYQLVKDKNYFVLTTNVDHQFQMAGFDKERLFYTQGDYGLFQCSEPCHYKTYDNEEIIIQMVKQQKNMKIPAKLVPHCPICAKPMTINLRSDDTFVEDDGWHKAAERYSAFLEKYQYKRILFLELGVGANTPGIIKYPFWKMTAKNSGALYVCINFGESCCPIEIEQQSVCINRDVGEVIDDLLQKLTFN